MAFDKVIDSAQLDGALLATANAIREKTGESGKILWNTNTGFASAIEALEIGGGDFDAFMAGNLTEFTNEEWTSIRKGAFYGYESLQTVNLPALRSIPEAAFLGCSSLTNINASLVTETGKQAFQTCPVSNYNFPNLAIVGENTFAANANLVSITLPAATSIANRAFMNCSALKTLTLPGSTVCDLTGTSVFQSCSALANIYVPSNLVSTYKAATNWSSHASKIKAIT